MPSYNFKKQFADLITDGLKTSTIRAKRKHEPLVGQMAHLFTGLRTTSCKRLLVAEITDVRDFEIDEHKNVFIDGELAGSLDVWGIAVKDGFVTTEELLQFFQSEYGLPFKGTLIRWEYPSGQ